MMSYHILIVDDEENILFTLNRFLRDEGYGVTEARTFEAAVDALGRRDFDLVFTDIMLDGKSGIDLLQKVKDAGLSCPVVMITGVPSVETAAESVRLGAFDYLPKPVLQTDLIRVAAAALKHKELFDEKERLRNNLAAIFASVRDGILTVDNDFKVIEANHAVETCCGFSRDELVGNSLENLAGSGCVRCLDILKKTMGKKGATELKSVTCQRKNGPPRVVSLSAGPLTGSDGRISGGVLVIRDETRLAALEKDLKKRTGCHNIIGKSEKMQQLYGLIENLAQVRSTALVTGESGTGKELVAEALHYMSDFADKPLVKVNCGTLSESLLESELFGHVKGAFSGAVRDREGRFQLAHGGTIFLDEIGEISPRMQIALLRVLQEKEFERVGDATPIKVDVRVVAATNRNLKQEVEEGRFRRDLYYRLKVMELALPPLRERKEDIPLLAEHFCAHFNEEMGRRVMGISEDVTTLMHQYPWPGNIRELKHVMEHAFILCRETLITPDHLPGELLAHGAPAGSGQERERIVAALKNSRWNKTRAAEILGMSRQHLYRKLKTFGINE